MNPWTIPAPDDDDNDDPAWLGVLLLAAIPVLAGSVWAVVRLIEMVVR